MNSGMFWTRDTEEKKRNCGMKTFPSQITSDYIHSPHRSPHSFHFLRSNFDGEESIFKYVLYTKPNHWADFTSVGLNAKNIEIGA